jgi:UDP-N-acetylglucosamine--N-acetylmuramyl-(pentapeptide) pyrophosphoryl-undecaprenol N-acetylglucosamine transferase
LIKQKTGRKEVLQQQSDNIRVVISGGGTGGHIFPAIAIANALKAMDATVEILFVGAEGKMEMEKVPAAGYKIVGLPIAGIKRELSMDNLSFPFKLVRSLKKAGSIIREFNPDVAVGVGGYASGPVLFVASRQGISSLIQEQNSFPGITNKILSRRAKKICVAYDGMERFFPKEKIVFTGNPVREDIKHLEGKRNEAAAFFGLDAGKKTLLIVGGSQGARSINRAILAGLPQLAASGYQVVWQTGKFFFPEAKKAIEELNTTAIKAYDFISKMDLAYAISDAVVARAGASTVSELCIVERAAILVPLPTAAEDHQTKNCMSLVQKDAALLVTDADAASRLVNEAINLIGDAELCKRLSTNVKPLAKPMAAKEIAEQVLALAKQKRA